MKSVPCVEGKLINWTTVLNSRLNKKSKLWSKNLTKLVTVKSTKNPCLLTLVSQLRLIIGSWFPQRKEFELPLVPVLKSTRPSNPRTPLLVAQPPLPIDTRQTQDSKMVDSGTIDTTASGLANPIAGHTQD